MNFKKIVSELKRRNVFKVATVYGITGWLIIQIITSISEPLSLPIWFDTAIIILVLIGFPISLIFAWAFEMTPEGLKKTVKVEAEQSVTKTTGKKLNKIIISVLSVFILFLLFDKVFNTTSLTDSKNAIVSLPSIAVLPFADMSPKNDQEYFSDGLSEELLNVLAKVNNIKVAGRTSSFKFKGKNDDIKKIGAELGVDHVLEGSVRKSGNTIRITAQLIKVSDGFHMWSETYDRDYSADEIFNIQDEISKVVLKELKIKLSIIEETNITDHKLTSNTEAYEAYLKGNQLLINRKPKEIEDAIVEFKKAIALDTKFAMAYARLATSYGHLFDYGNIKRDIAFKNMRKYIDKALLLNSNLGSAYAALGHYYQKRNFQFSKDDEESYKGAMKKAYELEPNNPEIIMWYGNSLDFDSVERMEVYLKAYEIDPLAPVLLNNLTMTSQAIGEYKKAEEFAKKNIELNPDYIRARITLIEMITSEPNSKFGEGFIEAHKAYKKYPKHLDVLDLLAGLSSRLGLHKFAQDIGETITKVYPDNDSNLVVNFNILMNKGNFPDAIKLLDKLLNKMNLKEGSENRLNLELFHSMVANESEKMIDYIEKHHPIYFSDTLTVLSENLNNSIPEVVSFLRKGDKEYSASITRLIKLLTSVIEKEYKFKGDITKEKNGVLWKLDKIAAITGDAKSFVAIINEQYFNRKIKNFNFIQFDIDPIYDDIKNTPEVKELLKRINEDKDIMRAKAVAYLKEEGLWSKYKEDNEK